MAKGRHVVGFHSLDNALFQHFNRDRMGDEMAHILSMITINWGKLEQALYLSMRSIDVKEADQWRVEFFSTRALAAKRARARKNMQASSLPLHIRSYWNYLAGRLMTFNIYRTEGTS